MEIPYNLICPYCGADQTIFVDPSARHQHYIEDCQVCCQPMELDVIVEGGEVVSLDVRRSDE